MTTPNKTVTFKVEENEYTVPFPNNGQFIKIETMKALLTRDTYGTMATGGTVESQMSRFTVDLIAFLSVMCPKLTENLKIGSLSDLDMVTTKALLKTYINTILPWFNEWMTLLNTDEVEEKPEA